MRRRFATGLFVAALTAVPVSGFAAPAAVQASTAAKHKSTNVATTHATRGIVKSIDTSTLVITRTGKKGGEMTFALNASTHREGTFTVGQPVSVRYREEGKNHVATAINVQPAKPPAAGSASSKR